MKSFQQTQLAFSKHLRAPEQYPAPLDIEDRRMGIYRDLIYNNIESFIAGAFPVLRSLMADDHWHAMVRDFIAKHHCQTPYFLEISQEFLQYVMQERGSVEGDPVFMLELAHYEWVELALDIADLVIPLEQLYPVHPLALIPRVSPLIFALTYQYPVHKISPSYQPKQQEVTHLLVYRNRADEVKFMSVNAMTLRLVFLLQQNENDSLLTVLEKISQELNHPDASQLISDGLVLVKQLHQASILSHFD